MVSAGAGAVDLSKMAIGNAQVLPLGVWAAVNRPA
jgi:hypothetical protein